MSSSELDVILVDCAPFQATDTTSSRPLGSHTWWYV